MGICNIPIKTDLKNKSYNALQACKQGDTLILDFDISDNSMMADLTGFACDLRANKSDGKGYHIINNVTIITSTGKATIKCPPSLTQFAGKLLLELTFTDTINNLQKTTFDIIIQVDKSVIGDSDGNVPPVIITALEELNENLAQISGKIEEAKTINNTLTNTNNTANSLNSALQATKNSADTSKANLDQSVNNAEQTITELQQANTAYTQHINNSDIHVTKDEKINWNNNLQLVQDLMRIVNMFIAGAYLVDENNNNIVDENGNFIIG